MAKKPNSRTAGRPHPLQTKTYAVIIIIIIIILIIKKGVLDQTTSDTKLDELAVIARLKDGEQYKFLGVQENLKQEDKLVLNWAAEVYLKKVSVIWSSPLSDNNSK